VAAAIIVIALAATLLYPQIKQLGILGGRLAEATAQADAAKLQLQERQVFKDRAVETSAKWLRLENQIPDNPDLPSLIIELQDAAFKSGVQVITVTPATPAPDSKAPGVETIPVSIEIVGSWADTVDYMQSLLKLDRGIRIADFNTKTTKSGPADAQRNLTVRPYSVDSVIALEAYLIPNGSSSGTSSTPTPAPSAAGP
jgi:type IV pilus assembly protein PilO